MHSRVAAVKAPRTHNRRRVTGSSGRRREGRESGRQRPNMSRHVFTSAVLLLVVVMMCCGAGAANAQDVNLPVVVSQPGKYFAWRYLKDGETVESLHVPSLVEMNGKVFAVAEAQCKNEGRFNGISSKILTLTEERTKEVLDKTTVKVQVLEECTSAKAKCPSQNLAQAGFQGIPGVRVSRPTTVVKGNDIYMLAGIYGLDGAAGNGKNRTDELGLLLAKGNVVGDGVHENRIYWNDVDALPSISNIQQKESLTVPFGSGGSGVKMEDGTLVFPMEGKKVRTRKVNGADAAVGTKTVSLFIYSADTTTWKLSKEIPADGCSDPSVVRWKDKKLMLMTACDGGRRRVYESGDMGESWTEALGTLSRVWGKKEERPDKGVGSGFITATIEDRDVMLVTLPVYVKKAEPRGNPKSELHLWLTDNTHIVDIGSVSGEGDDAAASSLLYKRSTGGTGNKENKEELIALYEKKKGGEENSLGMVSVSLTEQLDRVKKVLATWQEVSKSVSQLCVSLLAQKGASTNTVCSADKITNGLVGFLSSNFSDNTWRDEYLGVDATVTSGAGAEKTSDGVTFRGAGAEWPVGDQGENQLYHFANYNFTLVATVSMDKVPEGDTTIPVMGVHAMNGGTNTVLLGLSYNKEKKWQLLCGDVTDSDGHSSNWATDTRRHVVILLRNGSQGFAYVDGERVGNQPCTLDTTDLKRISHFYIGGNGGSMGRREDVSVTVTNLLLYNRPMNGNNIRLLNANEISVSKSVEVASNPHAVGGATGDGSTVCGSGLLPSLLLLLLGLWGFAAL
ncbi:trans-sialidase, putative [Trypanosoma cruzi marinkellei]|uniref:Trans-sialidase, putative n=1 Tax=Trypanosoma cruzi marinkellei TaxID=85056 RepID=K2NQI6_TRYCR|nr:trans-sialidase, putative [Trypanosoma cruzi marinkellei]